MLSQVKSRRRNVNPYDKNKNNNPEKQIYLKVTAEEDIHSHSHTHTYNVESKVAVAADVSCCILCTAVVQAVVVRTGTLDGERPLLVVNLMALLCHLHPILEPLTCRPASEMRIRNV